MVALTSGRDDVVAGRLDWRPSFERPSPGYVIREVSSPGWVASRRSALAFVACAWQHGRPFRRCQVNDGSLHRP